MAEMIGAPSRGESRVEESHTSSENNLSVQAKTPTPEQNDDSTLLDASAAVPDLIEIRTGIATVSDKTGLIRLGSQLAKHGVELIATEGTAKHLYPLRSEGLKLTDLIDYTGYPESLNGRLKTLHPRIQAGVLAIKGFHDHILQKPAVQAKFIDLIIVNLYPFEQVAARKGGFFDCIENVDIGGPALLRAGAKNHVCVTAVCDPADYDELIRELERYGGRTSLDFRRQCAQKVFELTSNYDRAIAAWFDSQTHSERRSLHG